MEAKEVMKKLKFLVYLYFHTDRRSAEYNELLVELELTDEIVTKAIEKCKYCEEFRRNSKYEIILQDFNAKATDEEKAIVFGILLLYILIETQNLSKK